MNIPDTVKVAGYTYNIERPESEFISGDDICIGVCETFSQTMKVAKYGSDSNQQEVFLHELCHAIIHAYCGDNQDEAFVDQFSKGLYQVIQDNPSIFIPIEELAWR